MQAFAVVIRRVEPERLVGRANVLGVNVPQPAQLGAHIPIQTIVCMATVASTFRGYPVI